MKRKINDFLKENQGKGFVSLGIQDESNGKFVKPDRILNKFFVRHLKLHLNLKEGTSAIGQYLYTGCKQYLSSSGFWTSKKGQTVFYYSWKKEGV